MINPFIRRSFLFKYIWNDRETKWYLLIAIITSPLIFSLYKYYYPFPNFSMESAGFINLATTLQRLDNTPPGYPYLLRLFGFFTHNDINLIIFQYIFLLFFILDLFFSVYFLLSPSKWVTRTLLLILLINPVYINMANLITPDAIFNGLTIFLFTNLLWQLIYPIFKRLPVIYLLILLTMFFDHNACWLIIPALGVIYFTRPYYSGRLFIWILFLGLPLFFIMMNIWRDRGRYPINALSGLGGWQLGSSALFAYYYAPDLKSDELQEKYRKLNDLVNHHKDSIKNLLIRPDFVPNNYYIGNPASPLRIYFQMNEFMNDGVSPVKKFNDAGNLYRNYGSIIIKKYPKAFAAHYIWPNLMFYYAPRSEAFQNYNRDVDTVEYEIADWFRYKSNKVSFRYHSWRIPFMHVRVPICFAIIKVVFLTISVCFFCLYSYKLERPKFLKFVFLVITVFFVNMIFSVITGANTIRSQVSIITILLIYDALIIQLFFKKTIVSADYLPDKKVINDEKY